MIWNELKDWSGTVEIDGEKFDSIGQARRIVSERSQSVTTIILHCATEKTAERKETHLENIQSRVYRVTVKQYMTRHATPEFDFMEKWNNDKPMPLRTMIGTIEKETRGMVYMKLHGDITAKVTQHCMKCGRLITNPVSQFFGMGPECGGHNYVNPFESEEELRQMVDDYRKNYLQKIVWEGWIIKSAITEQEVVDGDSCITA